MNKLSDHIRSRRLSARDELEFEAVYNQYWESIFKYVIRIVSDEEEAADVVQETFVAYWELCDKLKKVKSIKAYLFVMARNVAFKRFREQLKRMETEDRLVGFYGAPTESLEQLVGAKELSKLLDAEIDKLPQRMREVFVLSRKEHLSIKEIALRLNISDQTVKKQIYHSLKYLRLKIDAAYIPYLSLILLIDVLI